MAESGKSESCGGECGIDGELAARYHWLAELNLEWGVIQCRLAVARARRKSRHGCCSRVSRKQC